MNKITNKQNRARLIDTGNRLTTVRGLRVGGLGEKVKGLRKKTLTHTKRTAWKGDKRLILQRRNVMNTASAR